jgi:hypothetical protein
MSNYETSDTMENLRRVKEKCSLERLSRSPEEQKRHMEAVMKRAEAALGRPIVTVEPSSQLEEVWCQ